MFSQTMEYAIRAVVMLAYLQEEGAVGNVVLAEKAQVPPSYLSKIMQGLVKTGLVQSKRGVGGGFRLNREPEDITILDVMNAVDPMKRIRTCPLGLESHSEILCPMHARIDKAMAQVEGILSESNIAELLSDRSRPRPMIESVEFLTEILPPKK